MGHRFKAARPQPALRLLVDRFPAREIMRQHPPLGAGPNQPAQPVVDLAQVVAALQGLFALQTQLRSGEGPFLVAHIRRVGFACSTHAAFYPTSSSTTSSS